MGERAVALVDGEHYPPVTLDAIRALAERGTEVVAAVMLGGIEKLAGSLDLGGIPVIAEADRSTAIATAVETYRPAVFVDISDHPVLDTPGRFRLIARVLAAGVSYAGAGFRMDPPPRPVRTDVPTIAVIGTGKRTGKTAICAALARHLRARGWKVVLVAMGRGGPAEPVVTRGEEHPPTVQELMALADRGEHAASDTYEDAVVAGVTTVGARRAGAGLAGGTVHDTVARALEVASTLEPEVVLLEGSGTAIPPAHADVTILVVGGGAQPEDIGGGLGPFRLLISDLAVVTMAEEPVLRPGTLSALSSLITEVARDVPVVGTVFRPEPIGSVAGCRVYVATTAPDGVSEAIRRHLEEAHQATVVGISHRLADRPRLTEDLAEAEGTYEVLLTELKAAAIDVAARAATRAGARVVFFDNRPVSVDGDLGAAFDEVERLAARRALERR